MVPVGVTQVLTAVTATSLDNCRAERHPCNGLRRRFATHTTAADYTQRYFANHTDGLRPFTAEELFVTTT
jgi:hypothetical protein